MLQPFKILFTPIVLCCCCSAHFSVAAVKPLFFYVTQAEINFCSASRHELIRAQSTALKGIVDPVNRTLAFKVYIFSFSGFNSQLQKDHFNENYMETDKFPTASFEGKIIEDVDITTSGYQQLRVKGRLWIHGVPQERIFIVEWRVNQGVAQAKSTFTVPLADHNIRIPRIVTDKLAPLINVTLNASLQLR